MLTSIATITNRMVNSSIMLEDEFESDRVWHFKPTSSAAWRNFLNLSLCEI